MSRLPAGWGEATARNLGWERRPLTEEQFEVLGDLYLSKLDCKETNTYRFYTLNEGAGDAYSDITGTVAYVFKGKEHSERKYVWNAYLYTTGTAIFKKGLKQAIQEGKSLQAVTEYEMVAIIPHPSSGAIPPYIFIRKEHTQI